MAEDQGRAKGRERAAGRAARVVSAWSSRRGKARQAEPYVRRTRFGDVRLERLEAHQDGEGNHWVEVWATVEDGADPHFRIVNPPGLVEDPSGDVELHGRRWREDPLAAVAEVVAMHGGTYGQKRRRRTQG